MTILNKIGGMFSRKSASQGYDKLAEAIDAAGGGMVDIAGVSVSRKTALQVATVFACVRTIADGCATPDLHVYRKIDKKRSELADDIPEYRLLNRRPNAYQTSFEWRRMMTMHAALTGTGLSVKVRSFIDNSVKEFLPISPGNYTMYKTDRHEMRWRVYDEFGEIGDFGREDLFILNGVQWDYGEALDAVKIARNVVGLAIATEKAHTDLHKNGDKSPGFYSLDGTVDAEQYKALLKHVKRKIQSGDPLILDNGGKWTRYGMSGVDSQHIETRRFTVEEVCRIWGVFPIMVMHSDKTATFASSEAFFSAHLAHTLNPWHKNWAQELDEFTLDGSGPLYTKFDTRYLQQGSIKDRSQFIRTVTETGTYTRNEVRQEEGKDPIDGLDEPLTPMNMTRQSDADANAQVNDNAD